MINCFFGCYRFFSQVMDNFPLPTYRVFVSRSHCNHYVKKFRCYEQYLIMNFTQLNYRESLCDIEVCLRGHQNRFYDISICSTSVLRNILSKANECRDWCIYADFAQSLIITAPPLCQSGLRNWSYRHKTCTRPTIDLCLLELNLALFCSTKSAFKFHTFIDLRGNIPAMIYISIGRRTMPTHF